MLTKMTEEDWVLVLEVFDACRSRRGDKGRDDRSCYSGQVYRGRASGFQGAEPTGLPPPSTHWCRHGPAEPSLEKGEVQEAPQDCLRPMTPKAVPVPHNS